MDQMNNTLNPQNEQGNFQQADLEDFLKRLTKEEQAEIVRMTAIDIQIKKPVKMPVVELMELLVICQAFKAGEILIGYIVDEDLFRVIVIPDQESIRFTLTALQDNITVVWKIKKTELPELDVENGGLED
jgi:hypothetical protein